jgi:alpha-N-acetylgalactosaminidase
MGWMSWELFRCEDDCASFPYTCISEELYKAQTDGLEAGGFIDAGYTGIHMDDCWEAKNPPRTADTGEVSALRASFSTVAAIIVLFYLVIVLVVTSFFMIGRIYCQYLLTVWIRGRGSELYANTSRFPSGMKALGDYMHEKGATFGLYTAESPTTCGGYPASADHEARDAVTFASWGVDYMKVDGCGPEEYYAGGYAAMGAALEASGRDIVYSCSWPAYIGSNESVKPFATFIMDGCNLWRNWDDIQCDWGSLSSIIDYWGDWGEVMAPYAGPGHWHDMDMLLIGAGCVTPAEERTQMALWSISASPLIMGNDLRNVSDVSRAVLLNPDAIAVSQDALGQMGVRLSNSSDDATQAWARNLADGSVAVGLYSKLGAAPAPPGVCSGDDDAEWTHTSGGYYEACGGADGNLGSFAGLKLADAQAACCADAACAGFSFDAASGGGYYKSNAACGEVSSSTYDG